jgi:hypothetical protein
VSDSEFYPMPVAGASPGDFAALARALAQQGGVTLVYAPSTTTITAPAPIGATLPMPAPVQAFPSGAALVAHPEPRRGYTLGEVVMYSGATLMGAASMTELVWALLRVPMLVPVLGGALAVLGGLAVLAGAALDGRERHGGAR